MRKKKKKQYNYLEFIPEKSPLLKWYADEKELVILETENTGVFNTIAQRLFKKPRFTKIHLDEQGSFLWPLIDGKHTVMELASLQKEQFGEKSEPLYPRIVKYFQIMERCRLISFTNKTEN